MHELVYGATEVDGRLLGVILVGVALKLPEPHMQASAGMPQMLCEKVSVIRALHSVRPSEMSAFISSRALGRAVMAGQLAGL